MVINEKLWFTDLPFQNGFDLQILTLEVKVMAP